MEIERNYNVVAMQLLTLLSQNLLGDFHTEIESLPSEAYSNENIQKVIAMEQYFIEGRYNKVVETVQTLQLGDISSLFPVLKQTIVESVSETIQKAYNSLPVEYCMKVLMITNPTELMAIATEKKWIIENNKVIFTNAKNITDKTTTVKSFDNVQNTLSLIKEIDEMM